MYFIVVGGGRVGYYLTKELLEEGHEVLLVEQNARICNSIIEEMGSICVLGDGCETTILEEIGTSRANMLIAVTGDDEDNLVACQVAKHKFNVPRTIARIRNPRNEILFKKLGVDVTVSSTNLILEHIEEEVPTHPLTHLLEIRDKGLEIVQVRIAPDATTLGKTVKELPIPEECKLVLTIPEQGQPHLANANSVIQSGDHIIALTSPESEEKLRTALRGF